MSIGVIFKTNWAIDGQYQGWKAVNNNTTYPWNPLVPWKAHHAMFGESMRAQAKTLQLGPVTSTARDTMPYALSASVVLHTGSGNNNVTTAIASGCTAPSTALAPSAGGLPEPPPPPWTNPMGDEGPPGDVQCWGCTPNGKSG